jgi:hypothetical protein
VREYTKQGRQKEIDEIDGIPSELVCYCDYKICGRSEGKGRQKGG